MTRATLRVALFVPEQFEADKKGDAQLEEADPSDPGMLDVVGFDTATPDVVAGFAAGTL